MLKLKLYKYKYGNDNKLLESDKKNIIGKVIIKEKRVIKTIAIDKEYICNGKTLNSDFRTDYQLNFLDKYNEGFEYGDLTIEYQIRPGTIFTAFVRASYFQKVYLKILFKQYLIERIEGSKRVVWEFFGFIITIFITWYTSKC